MNFTNPCFLLTLLVVWLSIPFAYAQSSKLYPLKTADIRIRDPFVLVDTYNKEYLMYAQLDNRLNNRGDTSKPKGVEVYTSKDLKNWSQPETVLLLAKDAWARKMVWAPEVFKYKKKYYLFTTLTGKDNPKGMQFKPLDGFSKYKGLKPLVQRGTQIFYADSPKGPFLPFENKSHTASELMCLDGTLWVEQDVPYMVYCHEHRQLIDGTIDYIALSQNLSTTIGDSKRMFRASEAPWQVERNHHVTDGCFLYRTKTGKLLMIWSTFAKDGYCIAIAESKNGLLSGPWKHQPELLFKQHGGHG